MPNYLQIDYKYMPTQAKIFSAGFLKVQWSEKNPKDLVGQVIDNTELSIFDKVKMKRMVNKSIDLFDPVSVKIKEV